MKYFTKISKKKKTKKEKNELTAWKRLLHSQVPVMGLVAPTAGLGYAISKRPGNVAQSTALSKYLTDVTAPKINKDLIVDHKRLRTTRDRLMALVRSTDGPHFNPEGYRKGFLGRNQTISITRKGGSIPSVQTSNIGKVPSASTLAHELGHAKQHARTSPIGKAF